MLKGNGNIKLINGSNNENTREIRRGEKERERSDFAHAAIERSDAIRSFHSQSFALLCDSSTCTDSFAFCQRCERFQFWRDIEKKGEGKGGK